MFVFEPDVSFRIAVFERDQKFSCAFLLLTRPTANAVEHFGDFALLHAGIVPEHSPIPRLAHALHYRSRRYCGNGRSLWGGCLRGSAGLWVRPQLSYLRFSNQNCSQGAWYIYVHEKPSRSHPARHHRSRPHRRGGVECELEHKCSHALRITQDWQRTTYSGYNY